MDQNQKSNPPAQKQKSYKYDSLPDVTADDGITEPKHYYGTNGSQSSATEDEQDTDCLIRSCNRFGNPISFLCLIIALYAMGVAASTYLGGCISTIEKQFQITSSQSGLIATVNDVISLSVVVFVTHYGAKSHRPRVLGVSAIIIALGFFSMALPHFTSDPLVYTDNQYNLDNSSDEFTYIDNELCSMDNDIQDDCSTGDTAGSEQPGLLWIIVGQVFIGLGSSTLFPLTITYLDDSTVDPTTTSIYIAAIFLAMGIGPFLGFVVSSQCLSLYVDFERLDEDLILTDQKDPRWIGAWWLGFLIFSVVILLLAIPFFFFPRQLKKFEFTCCKGRSKKKDDEDDGFNMGDLYKQDLMEGQGIIANLKGLLVSLKRLVCNPTLVLLNLAISCDLAIVGGFAFFIAKYVETQFGVSASTASLVIGVINLPGTILSNILSSYVVKRFKLNQCGYAKMLLIVATCSVALAFPLLFIGCSNPEIAGLTTHYNYSNEGALPNLDNICNSDCACSDSIYKPVCGSDGITYTSACQAGCNDIWRDGTLDREDNISSNDTIYIGCSCIYTHNVLQEGIEGGFATEGQCDWSCNTLIPFVLLVATVTIFTSLKPNPNIMLSIRCVDPEDRALSIAFGGVIVRVLGFFPAPIYFGAVIANTCLVRQESCNRSGACILYDIEEYRYAFFGLFTGLKIMAVIFSMCTYCSINPDRLKKNKNEPVYSAELANVESNGNIEY